MVIDKIENHKLYQSLSPRIAQAFTYLQETDLAAAPTGKHEIDGDNVFAIVMEYETKAPSESKFEGHYRYIDLQYVISGTERIGITTRTDQVPVISKEEDDYDLYELEAPLVEFPAGTFMIFFPDDLHMPGIQFDSPTTVKKVVVKVKI